MSVVAVVAIPHPKGRLVEISWFISGLHPACYSSLIVRYTTLTGQVSMCKNVEWPDSLKARVFLSTCLLGIESPFLQLSRSASCHANPAIETNDLAIQHRVLDDMFCQGCVFRRPSQALGEWHLLAERDASGFWQTCQ